VAGSLALVLSSCDSHRASAPPAVQGTAASGGLSATANAAPRSAVDAPPLARPAAGALPQPRVVVPASQIHSVSDLRPGERRPLLIFLHGLGASGKVAFDVLRMAELGARERIFVVAPDGDIDHSKRQFWNAGTACCNFDRLAVDDVARLTALIDEWRARPDIDSTRVYLAGHSNGGFMTERLACSLGDRIAAAASLSGAAPAADDPCTPGASLALLEVHGDADAIVRYAGGRVFDSSALAPFPAIPRGFRDWPKRLGCTGEPRPGADLDLDPRLSGARGCYERRRRGVERQQRASRSA